MSEKSHVSYDIHPYSGMKLWAPSTPESRHFNSYDNFVKYVCIDLMYGYINKIISRRDNQFTKFFWRNFCIC